MGWGRGGGGRGQGAGRRTLKLVVFFLTVVRKIIEIQKKNWYDSLSSIYRYEGTFFRHKCVKINNVTFTEKPIENDKKSCSTWERCWDVLSSEGSWPTGPTTRMQQSPPYVMSTHKSGREGWSRRRTSNRRNIVLEGSWPGHRSPINLNTPAYKHFCSPIVSPQALWGFICGRKKQRTGHMYNWSLLYNTTLL